jgi:hypothetical protein
MDEVSSYVHLDLLSARWQVNRAADSRISLVRHLGEGFEILRRQQRNGSDGRISCADAHAALVYFAPRAWKNASSSDDLEALQLPRQPGLHAKPA